MDCGLVSWRGLVELRFGGLRFGGWLVGWFCGVLRDGVASCRGEAAGDASAGGEQGVRRLPAAESAMGVGVVRHFHVFGVLGEAPGSGRAH